jgi:Family of unknown function (DUF5681)
MTTKNKKTDDYNVGYGKPPKRSRFKPGTSGNPRGRPKGTKNLRTIVRDTLFEKVKVTEGGKVRTMNRVEAIMTGMVAKALKGDLRAATAVLKLANQHFPPGQETEPLKVYIRQFTDGKLVDVTPQVGARDNREDPWAHLRGPEKAPKSACEDNSDDR